ncbi:MAG: hypothetical protein HY930_01665 [Euryarchaeota archaeon]|nr:hypothetical protein [Euryarchaeota archaeon]
MANVTLSLPENMHRRMKKFSEVRWSEVARKAIEKKVADLELLEKLTSRSTLTEKDAEEISGKINREVAKRLLA